MKRTAKAAKQDAELAIDRLYSMTRNAQCLAAVHELRAALRLARKEARERERKKREVLSANLERCVMDLQSARKVGRQFANIAHNWKQRPGHVLSAADCLMLERLQKEWDNT